MTKPMYAREFESASEFFGAVAAAAAGGMRYDDRLQMMAVASGANEAGGAEGAFLVPTDFSAVLWKKVYQTGGLLRRCGRQTVTHNELMLPGIAETSRADGSRFGGVRTWWTDEAAPALDSKLQFESMRLDLHKLLALAYVTDELVEDAAALVDALQRAFALESVFVLEDAIINGSGVTTPLGVLSPSNRALITVDAQESQAAGTVSAQNFADMAARLWGPSHASAVWLFNNDVYRQIGNASFANGSPVLETGPNGAPTILQMPVMLCEYTRPIGSAGDIVLMDPTQYLICEKEPQFISSLHVRFLYDESAFKFRYRADGAPAWRGPLQPRNSSATQSAFVTLSART